MKTILWLDDDERLLDESAPLFERNGFHIFKALNVTQALTLLRERTSLIDGMIIDVKLAGGEDGLAFLADLHQRYPGIPKVVFTAYPEYDDHVRAEQDGANLYFEKIDKSIPLDPAKQAKFFQALHRVLSAKTPNPAQGHRCPPIEHTRALWGRGVFFLLLFVVVIAAVIALARFVSPWLLAVTLLGAILLFALVGVFVLRTQQTQGVSERNLVSVIRSVLETAGRVLPLFKKKDKSKRN